MTGGRAAKASEGKRLGQYEISLPCSAFAFHTVDDHIPGPRLPRRRRPTDAGRTPDFSQNIWLDRGHFFARIGARKVLSSIVLWWSVFTSATGVVSSIRVLLAVRFLFGAGEACAFPNSARAISRWFPATERARAHGIVWMASRLGGAVTPLIIIPLQTRFGWRVGFHFLGLLGAVWAVIWYIWFRDRPANKAGIAPLEVEEI